MTWRVLRLLGQGALLGYLLHGAVVCAIQRAVPKDAPLWPVVAGFFVFFGTTCAALALLERNRVQLRL